jgi:GT2 family glycosyltransferase
MTAMIWSTTHAHGSISSGWDDGSSSDMPDSPSGSRFFGVLVTFRRPDALTSHLHGLTKQSRRLDHLVVVDNGPTAGSRAIVNDHGAAATAVEHLEMSENLGPAGALSRGLARVLELAEHADDDPWVVLLDDDDPPEREDLFEELLAFADSQVGQHPRLGMVGLVGARFDFRKGRIIRLRDDELHDAVAVDYIGGSQLPLVRVAAVRDVGVFDENLFFGFDDLEFGLRLRRGSYDILVDGALAHWGRVNAGRLGDWVGAPQLAGTNLRPWRRYYSLRNLIVILRRHGRWRAALRMSLTAGVAKGVVLLVRQPRAGGTHLVAGLRAVVDGWFGRLGRRLDPS